MTYYAILHCTTMPGSGLSERFGGRREFDLRDIEMMRVDDAIAGRTFYAKDQQSPAGHRKRGNGF